MHRGQGDIAAPLQLQDRCQFQTRKVLQDVEDGFLVYTALDVSVTFIARQHDQAIRFDLLPEGLVVHRLKPVFNIVYVSEFHDEYIISNQPEGLQKSTIIEGIM